MLPIGTIDGIVLSGADIRAISFGVYPRKSSILVFLQLYGAELQRD